MSKAQNIPTPFFRQRIVVLAAGFGAMLLAAASAWLAWRTLPEVPVREVLFVNAVAGEFAHVKAEDLGRVARAVAATRVSVLRTDLAEVKAAVEQVSWVRRADVRRRLPNKIEVSIEEQEPFAIWRNVAKPPANPTNNDDELPAKPDELINRFGEVFKGAVAGDQQGALPVLIGPPEAAKVVLLGFGQFAKQLAAIERTPRELRLSVRRAWTIKLDNGIALEVGRSDADLRLARFVQAYRQAAALQTPGVHLDLRYHSGLALRTASIGVLAATPAAPTKTSAKAKRI